MSSSFERFIKVESAITGLFIITRLPLSDSRGEFERMFCAGELASCGFPAGPVQINRSLTRKRGTVRGMHFQYPPHAEVKMVSCVRGEVFDVAVDLRKNSATYLHAVSQILSPDNHKSMLIPAGCAHGFQTITDDCELMYCHSAVFRPDAEGGLWPLDPTVAIKWPLPVSDISARDSALQQARDFEGIKA